VAATRIFSFSDRADHRADSILGTNQQTPAARRQRVLNLYRRENVVGALDKLKQNADLPIARIFLAALQLEQPTPEEFRLALESEAQAELPILKRFNTVFDTIISISPLLGLLGTILGLIASFASLTIGDVGGSTTTGVTSGISEALVSTASGLVVAIFTLLFANTFRGLYLRQTALIQEYGGQIELLYRRQYERQECLMRLPDEPELPTQINIVPMIDVIFAILTFFIISTLYLTRTEGLPVNLPSAKTAQSQRSTPITVTLDQQGRIALNRKVIDINALAVEVRSLIAPNQEVVVVLNADTQVNHGQVIAVMDQLRSVKGAKLAIATQKP
jgi:biopolymer transport protein ExbB